MQGFGRIDCHQDHYHRKGNISGQQYIQHKGRHRDDKHDQYSHNCHCKNNITILIDLSDQRISRSCCCRRHSINPFPARLALFLKPIGTSYCCDIQRLRPPLPPDTNLPGSHHRFQFPYSTRGPAACFPQSLSLTLQPFPFFSRQDTLRP